jgi:hypothetical protein
MKLKDLVIVIAVAMVVFIVGSAITTISVSTKGKDKVIVKSNGELVTGSVVSNAPTDPFYLQGGFTSQAKSFTSTTTVACMFQNPTNATTTFSARWSVPTATTTTTVLAIATTTNASRFATSTAILSKTLSATAGESSYTGANNQNLLGPGEWVQIGYGAGTTLPTVAQQQTGFCSVSFMNIR